MSNNETKLGLFGLIKQQQRANQLSDYDSVRSDNWNVYGDKIGIINKIFGQRALIRGYQKTFYEVLNGISLVEFASKKQEIIAIDIMAPSDILADLFTRGGINTRRSLGVAVSFLDKRTQGKKSRDDSLNIHQINGDVMDNRTWNRIEEKLNGRKAHLIMERALGGFEGIPNNPIFYASALVRIWKLLSNQGGMFVGEAHGIKEKLKDEIVDYLRRNNIDILINGTTVRIIKTSSSPDDIGPILRKFKSTD